MAEVQDIECLDITSPEIVEVEINHNGKVVWINVDGVCRLRACRIKNVKIIDNRCTCGPDSDALENLKCPIHGIMEDDV